MNLPFLNTLRLQKRSATHNPSQVLFFVLFSLLISWSSFGQKQKVEDLTDEQVKAFIQKAQSSGMSESQIEKAAILQGFTPADVAKMRERIEKIKQEEGKKTNQSEILEEKPIAGRAQKGTKLSKVTFTDSTDTNKKDSVLVKKTKVFGASLFSKESLTFEPDLRIPTPRNYQLGPDDELNVDIFGNALDNYKLKISPEGTVRILNLSPIYVNGLTIEAASERIVARLRQLYQGINVAGSGVSAQITLGNVRSIKVTITGEVARAGSYTVSSLATLFNALYMAGGPSENGSYRNIRLIRDNKVVRILDLYDFLLRADQKDNVRLQDQDVIRIADYDTRVELSGEVKRPFIFEVEKGETLKDILRFAGGFTDKAYTYAIQLKRNTAKELKLINVAQEEVATFIPKSGDKYTIGTILERYENRVKISGSVFRPGEYALEKGVSTVKELIKIAEGLKPDAFKNRATLKRQKDNDEFELVGIDLNQLMTGVIDDIPLKREDHLTIFSVLGLKEKRIVRIDGEVNNAGNFDYIEGMTVADLILLAKGFTEGASYAKLELSRRVKDDTLDLASGQNVRIIVFDIDKELKLAANAANYVLQPFDKLNIRKSPRYEEQKTVFVEGEVAYPGTYTIKDKTQRITDIIRLAGGLKNGAFPKGATFQRDTAIVAIDLDIILKQPEKSENLLLIDGDKLMIPRRLETVKLSGELLNPVSVAYREGLGVRDYLAQAGGLTENAVKGRIFVKYANGLSDRTRKFFVFKSYPSVEPGAEIIVPSSPKESGSKLSTGERIAILGAISSLAYIIVNIINTVK
ncbi:SLBB domain-containing protein [Flectobacillus major]|uniref:SLBB domain-containing protein n=1 Tax=Flectobacillus major TaxID=103 RepID=UPI00040A7850|nr:SLBB domain-containing protein [Flectobacillus major]